MRTHLNPRNNKDKNRESSSEHKSDAPDSPKDPLPPNPQQDPKRQDHSDESNGDEGDDGNGNGNGGGGGNHGGGGGDGGDGGGGGSGGGSGGGGGGGSDGGGDNNGGQGSDEEDNVDTDLLLARAINNLNNGLKKLHPSSTKVKEPESFDGMNPQKLREFLVACSLIFADCPDSFRHDKKMVRYAISYLKGAALDWFEPVIMGEVDDIPAWVNDYGAFVQELSDHFGPYHFRGDAETALSNLTMKDSQRITRYIVEFNKLAARTNWNEPALRDKFFRGLPLHLHTDLLKSGKPKSLSKMCLKAQSYDQAYWVTKDEVTKSSPSTQSTNAKDKDKPSYSDKKRYTPSDQQSTSQSGFHPNNTSSLTNSFSKNPSPSSGSTRKPDLSEKLGKDGKLRSDERKRRMEKNLCLYCGAGSHSAKDCRKSTSTCGRAAQASSSSISVQPATESSDSKK